MKMISSEQAPPAIGPYSQAIGLDQLVFTSGQIGMNLEGQLVSGGVEAELRQALGNLEAVLKAAGASFSAVIKVTLFLVDMNDFAAVNAIYAEAFGESRPARSCVEVAGLPRGAAVELECIALRS